MRILITVLLLCISAVVFAQVNTSFRGTLNIYQASGASPNYEIRGIFNDTQGQYTSDSVDVGDVIFILEGSNCARLVVTNIISTTGGIIRVDVTDGDAILVNAPLGNAAILEETPNYGFPTFVDGISNDLLSCIQSHFALQVDDITSGSGGIPGTPGNTQDTVVQVAHGLSLLDPVFVNASGNWILANISDEDSCHMAIVTEVISADTLILTYNGLTTQPAHGYTVGSVYFVQDDGTYATTVPTNFINDIAFYVISDSTLYITEQRPISPMTDLNGIYSSSDTIPDGTIATGDEFTIRGKTNPNYEFKFWPGNDNIYIKSDSALLTFSSGEVVFRDYKDVPTGIEYNGSGYVTNALSLTTKEYVDSTVAAVPTDNIYVTDGITTDATRQVEVINTLQIVDTLTNEFGIKVVTPLFSEEVSLGRLDATTGTRAILSESKNNIELRGNATDPLKLAFLEETAQGTNFSVIRARDTLSSNTDFILPNNNGSYKQMLETDGQGRTSWNYVDSDNIENYSIQAVDLDTGSVNSTAILDGTITTADLAFTVVTDLSFSGVDSLVTLHSSTGTDVDLIAGDGIRFEATDTTLTITGFEANHLSEFFPICDPDISETYPEKTKPLKPAIFDRYVDSVLGDDGNDGLTPETAWKTLSKLTDLQSVAYDTIDVLVTEGVFKTGIVLAGNSSGRKVTRIFTEGEVLIDLDSSLTHTQGLSVGSELGAQTGIQEVILVGPIEIREVSNNGVATYYGGEVSIWDATIHRCRDGMSAHYTGKLWAFDCNVRNCGKYAIAHISTTTETYHYRCTIEGKNTAERGTLIIEDGFGYFYDCDILPDTTGSLAIEIDSLGGHGTALFEKCRIGTPDRSFSGAAKIKQGTFRYCYFNTPISDYRSSHIEYCYGKVTITPKGNAWDSLYISNSVFVNGASGIAGNDFMKTWSYSSPTNVGGIIIANDNIFTGYETVFQSTSGAAATFVDSNWDLEYNNFYLNENDFANISPASVYMTVNPKLLQVTPTSDYLHFYTYSASSPMIDAGIDEDIGIGVAYQLCEEGVAQVLDGVLLLTQPETDILRVSNTFDTITVDLSEKSIVKIDLSGADENVYIATEGAISGKRYTLHLFNSTPLRTIEFADNVLCVTDSVSAQIGTFTTRAVIVEGYVDDDVFYVTNSIPSCDFATPPLVFDVDYQYLLDYCSMNSISVPSYAQQILQNQMVISLKDSAIWDELDVFYVLANDADRNMTALNWKNPDTLALTFNNGVHTPNQGWATSGSPSITINFNIKYGVQYTQNDAHYGLWFYNSVANYSGGSPFESILSGTRTNQFTPNTGGSFYYRVNSSASAGTAAAGSTNGFFMGNRTSSTAVNLYRNGTLVQSDTKTSTTIPDGISTVISGAYAPIISFISFGSNINAQASAFYSVLNTYLSSL